MSQVKVTAPNGTVYVYESESYWDKDLKQPRNRRKLIGKIDPNTGEIVPTRKKQANPHLDPVNESEAISALKEKYEKRLEEKDALIAQQKREIQILKKKNTDVLNDVKKLIDKYE